MSCRKGTKGALIRKHCRMTRRDFVKLAAMASVAAGVPSGLVRAAQELLKALPEATVGLAGVPAATDGSAVVTAVRQAAEAVTDFSWLSRGDAVLIKPSINSGNPYPATTHPAGVKAMVALLREKGAGKVVVSDMSGIEHVKLSPDGLRGSTRDLAASAGIARAAVEAGATLYFPEEEGWGAFFEDAPVTESHWKAGIMMPKFLKEVDHVVLLPRCSRHALAGATLGMKAAVGYWRTDSRLEYHHDAATFHEKTAEASTVSSLREKQRLTLTVADKVLATYGPDKGYVVTPDIGLVFASESLVAHDMVSLAWLLEARQTVPDDQKTFRNDPNTNRFVVNMANRWVVRLLGGVAKAASADSLQRKDLESIWDDRVLRRAFELGGGIPSLKFVMANLEVPAEVTRKLSDMPSR